MADRQKFTNNAVLTLGLDLSTTATILTLTAGDGVRTPILAAGEFFLLTLIDSAGDFEIVRVTARTIDTCTIVRGREGTTPRAFTAGDAAEVRWTRESIERLPQKNADESFTGAMTFTTPVTIADATAANHAMPKGQADAAYLPAGTTVSSGELSDVNNSNAGEGKILRLRSGVLVYEHPSPEVDDISWGGSGLFPGTFTWTIPGGVRVALVELVSAGGGGGQSLTRTTLNGTALLPGGAGGAGAYARRVIRLDGLTSVQIIIGAAGEGGYGSGSGTTGTQPTAGGDSAFGNLLSATGGGAGENAVLGGTNSRSGVDGADGVATSSVLPSSELTPFTSRGNRGGPGDYSPQNFDGFGPAGPAGQIGMVVVTVLG